MSAAGSSDPRVSRADTRANPHTQLLIHAIEASRLSPGSGLYGTQHFGGTALSAKRQRRGSGLASIAFQIRRLAADSIRVWRGPIATPDGTFVPAGFSDGDTPVYELTGVTGSGRVWLSVSVDDDTGEVLSADAPDFGETMPDNTAATYYLELGSYITDAEADPPELTVQSNDLGPLYFELCGGVSPKWGGFHGA